MIAFNSLQLYEQMLRSRLFEEGVSVLWEQGLISGEMHASLGEEAIAAGVVCQLEEGDAMALDHRSTAPLVMRGVPLVSLLKEFMGKADGLCSGQGGHMHLFSRKHLAVSSGIVGASGPAALGFALAAQHLRPKNLAVALFGEGAMNQGMLLESINLAVVWKLPVLFICKDNQWSLTTPSREVTGGDLYQRAAAFDLPSVSINGLDVQAVWEATSQAIERARSGQGPSFVQATCVHLEGHILGDPLFRATRYPIKEMAPMTGPMLNAFLRKGGVPIGQRLETMSLILHRIREATGQALSGKHDPLILARQKLTIDPAQLEMVEKNAASEIYQAIEYSLTA